MPFASCALYLGFKRWEEVLNSSIKTNHRVESNQRRVSALASARGDQRRPGLKCSVHTRALFLPKASWSPGGTAENRILRRHLHPPSGCRRCMGARNRLTLPFNQPWHHLTVDFSTSEQLVIETSNFDQSCRLKYKLRELRGE